jgi:flavin reductase (DIM6/NTAB) family NADH-FMN oxidoreductase RutF
MITHIDLNKAYRLLNHGPTILISSCHNGKQNIRAAAWACALDFNPTKITVVIDKSIYTSELMAIQA